jgi:hypothetical protein
LSNFFFVVSYCFHLISLFFNMEFALGRVGSVRYLSYNHLFSLIVIKVFGFVLSSLISGLLSYFVSVYLVITFRAGIVGVSWIEGTGLGGLRFWKRFLSFAYHRLCFALYL